MAPAQADFRCLTHGELMAGCVSASKYGRLNAVGGKKAT
jgi:hypothetical protein